MHSFKQLGSALALTLLSGFASAQVTALTFEGTTGGVNNFYAGGVDQNGNAGPNVGVSMTNGAAVITHNGGNSYGPPIVNEPSGKTVLWIRDQRITFNKPAGFSSGFSLMYTALQSNNGTVNVWSGLNGTGTLLATFPLPGQAQCNVLYAAYCNWSSVGAAFAGVAQSVTLSANAPLSMWLDNVTFGSVSPLTAASNPAALMN